jgi:hypothetical protein
MNLKSRAIKMNSYYTCSLNLHKRDAKWILGPMCIKVIDICLGKSIEVSGPEERACFAILEAVWER